MHKANSERQSKNRFFVSRSRNYSGNPNTIFKRTLKGQILTAPVLDNLLIKGNVIANSSAVVRKTLFYQIGFICEKEELVAPEDYHT